MQNHFYFSKPSNSWKEQKNTFISKIDSVHSTKLIVMVVPHFTCDIIMVPFATCAPNIANISCWKLHSNHSCILIKEAYWIIMHLYLVKQRYNSPNGPHLLRVVQPIRSLENPGTTLVSIGHWTPWPENPGYHTQVWDKASDNPLA